MLDHLVIAHGESCQNLNHSAEFWRSFSVQKEEEILADFSSSQSKFLLVAIHENRIIGGLGFVGSEGPVHGKNGSLGVSIQNEFAGLGLGTHLIQLCIENAKKLGFHRIELSVRTFNKAGIALYEKMGFQKIGTLREIAFIDGKYVDEFSCQLVL